MTSRIPLHLLRLLCSVLLVWTAPALAHTRSESQSSWRSSGPQLLGVFQVDAHRVTQLVRSPADLDDLAGTLLRHLQDAIQVRQEDRSCVATTPRKLTAEAGQLRFELVFTCPGSIDTTAAEVTISAFRSVSPGHVHYVRITQPGGTAHEAVIAGAVTSLRIGGPGKISPDSFGAFLLIGLEHVLSGADHLAFLIALVLLAGHPRSAVLMATGFTLGHSLTLGLVAFGWLKPHGTAIEALIGFTIAVTAALAGGTRGQTRVRRLLVLSAAAAVAALPLVAPLVGHATPPWPVFAGAALFAAGFGMHGADSHAGPKLALLLAVAFGLVHGAGFAGGLLELELPKERLLGALLAFNIGVEMAQLGVLALCAALATVARWLPLGWLVAARAVASACLFGIGTYWFVARSIL